MAAFDLDYSKYNRQLRALIKDSGNYFSQMFSSRATSFIAPTYTWPEELIVPLKEEGIVIIQGIRNQKIPRFDKKNYSTKFRKIGYSKKQEVYNSVRNAWFEPSNNPDHDWIDSCLADINIAFRWNKPAVISSHRVNFIGSLSAKNRDRNVKAFRALLRRILKRWPETEFISSSQLGELMAADSK